MSRILFVGAPMPGGRTLQRVRALRELGHEVTFIPTTRPDRRFEDRPSPLERLRYRLRLPADEGRANPALVDAARSGADIVWLESAYALRRRTLQAVRELLPKARIVWNSEDDAMNWRHRSRYLDAALPLIDIWVTTKSCNVRPEELPAHGVRHALFIDNSFDPSVHRPMAIDAATRERFGAPVSFVGTFEAERAASLGRLAREGIPVRVWGNGWESLRGRHAKLTIEGRPVYDDDYAKAISASDISLCFLRRLNRDNQTTRSVEIPACGGFMLHERNDEIRRLFAEDVEASYFTGDDELVAQCRRWLADPAGRARVAAAARRRAVEGGHSHHDRLGSVVLAALEVRS